MKITRIGHSGFLIELLQLNLVFDYFTDKAGVMTQEIFSGRKTCVFVSHNHGDHFNPQIFKWAGVGDVSYVLDTECKTPEMANIHKLEVGRSLDLPEYDVSVKAFGSTDEGLSYLVKTQGTVIFHAGDLNSWYWEDEKTPEELESSEGEYLSIIKELPVEEIDVAFIPEDPRLGRHADRAVKLFEKLLRPGRIIPMHFPGQDGEIC